MSSRNQPILPSGTDIVRSRILVLDENAVRVQRLRERLKEFDSDIRHVHTDDEALSELEAGEFAVVLVNGEFSGASAFHLAKRIRQLPQARRTPILFLSPSEPDRSRLEDCFELGAIELFVEPI